MAKSDKNGLADLGQLIIDHESLWGKSHKEATIVECRDFAEEHSLKLPSGLPQSKEAFVAMFVCCRLSNGWEGKKDFHEIFPKLTGKHKEALFAYRNRLATEGDAPNKGSHLRMVSSSTASELAEYNKKRHHKVDALLPTDPNTGKRFKSKKAWHVHNAAMEEKYRASKADSDRNTETSRLPINPKTGKPFSSKKAWHDFNADAEKRFNEGKASAKKSASEEKPKSLEEELQSALIAANSGRQNKHQASHA
ncbi:hypothetical protein ACFL6I_18305 [candidate division KSB1 bacterium]